MYMIEYTLNWERRLTSRSFLYLGASRYQLLHTMFFYRTSFPHSLCSSETTFIRNKKKSTQIIAKHVALGKHTL